MHYDKTTNRRRVSTPIYKRQGRKAEQPRREWVKMVITAAHIHSSTHTLQYTVNIASRQWCASMQSILQTKPFHISVT